MPMPLSSIRAGEAGRLILVVEDNEINQSVIRQQLALMGFTADIAARGFAWAFEEFVDGLNSVAAPIRDARGRVVGAIHAHGPAYRFPGDADADDVGQLVAATAHRVQL